ncbi:MAG: hypothetical protein C0621_10295 [Desulfuromonas sp.]|nr:MAG: hypothetical protein C0621_10295 [Desulfuromonas sp.]
MTAIPPAERKSALVLAGGGIMGAAYEIGCLSALDRLFSPGFSCRHFDMYVGVSAGSIIAALVASRLAPTALFKAIINDEHTAFNWHRSDIYKLDLSEVAAGILRLLRNTWPIIQAHRRNHWSFSIADLFSIIQEQFPAGLFSLTPMEEYLRRTFAAEGLSTDFTRLHTELYIPAYDLDLGRRVVFGAEPFRDVNICQAITASCAIPYFFRPHQVKEGYYIDGSYGRVSHIDIAIEQGAKLIVLVNPRVPMENDRERFCMPTLSFGQCSSIAELGITHAWEQSMRIETKEKLEMAVQFYRRQRPDVDIVILEPGREESLLFFLSPMSNASRNHVMSYGYQLTIGQLRERYNELAPIFARHGILTRDDRLFAPAPGTDGAPEERR